MEIIVVFESVLNAYLLPYTQKSNYFLIMCDGQSSKHIYIWQQTSF